MSVKTDIGPFAMVPLWLATALPDGSAMRVWIALHKWANYDTGHARPKKTTIASETGLSVKTVERALNALRDVGALTWTPRWTEDGDRDSNEYVLHYTDPSLVTLPTDTGTPMTVGTDTGDVTGTDTGDVDNKTHIEQERNTSSPAATTREFDGWWALYPRKVGRADAKRAYARALEKGFGPDFLLTALRHQAGRLGRDLRYCPHPSTWLNQERWNDEQPSAPPARKELPAYEQMMRNLPR